MILLSADVETTGLDRINDRITELGAILYSTGQRRCLESVSYLVKSEVPIPSLVSKLTGISQAALDRYGYDSLSALETFLDLVNQADAIVGQNIVRFDKIFFENWCRRHGSTMPEKLYIDTRTDLPGVESKTLTLMAAEAVDPVTGRHCGFVNLNPHSALSDCETVLKLVEMHDINKVVERAKSPNVILISHQKYEDNEQAKKLKFAWAGNDFKIWYRVTKQMDMDEIVKAAPFNISVAGPELTLEKLWYS